MLTEYDVEMIKMASQGKDPIIDRWRIKRTMHLYEYATEAKEKMLKVYDDDSATTLQQKDATISYLNALEYVATIAHYALSYRLLYPLFGSVVLGIYSKDILVKFMNDLKKVDSDIYTNLDKMHEIFLKMKQKKIDE